MSAGHTPGPWMRDGISVTVERPAGQKRTAIVTSYPDTSVSSKLSYDRMIGNARLIAAAPEMLEALIEARRAIGDHFAPNDCYATGPLTGDPLRDLVQCPACHSIPLIEAAILKATGESSLRRVGG